MLYIIMHLLAPHEYKLPTIMNTSLAANFENDIILSLR